MRITLHQGRVAVPLVGLILLSLLLSLPSVLSLDLKLRLPTGDVAAVTQNVSHFTREDPKMIEARSSLTSLWFVDWQESVEDMRYVIRFVSGDNSALGAEAPDTIPVAGLSAPVIGQGFKVQLNCLQEEYVNFRMDVTVFDSRTRSSDRIPMYFGIDCKFGSSSCDEYNNCTVNGDVRGECVNANFDGIFSCLCDGIYSGRDCSEYQAVEPFVGTIPETLDFRVCPGPIDIAYYFSSGYSGLKNITEYHSCFETNLDGSLDFSSVKDNPECSLIVSQVQERRFQIRHVSNWEEYVEEYFIDEDPTHGRRYVPDTLAPVLKKTVDMPFPGSYAVVTVENVEGINQTPILYFTVLDYGDEDCQDLYPARCADDGDCRDGLGLCTDGKCICPHGTFGVFCEYGCVDGLTINVTGDGGTLTDKSGPWPAAVNVQCTWTIFAESAVTLYFQQLGTGIAASITAANTDDENESKYVVGNTSPGAILMNANAVTIVWETMWSFSRGFELVWVSSSCPTNHYIHVTDGVIDYQNPTLADFNYNVFNSLSITCESCKRSQYQPNENSFECINCPIGTGQPPQDRESGEEADTNSCPPCPTGSFAKAEGMEYCENCPVGFFQQFEGRGYCDPAPAGSYVDVVGAPSYTPCSMATYQELTNSSECTPCPPNSDRQADGGERYATSRDSCMCMSGYWLQSENECVACPAGGSCAGGTESVVAERGNWAVAGEPSAVRSCIHPEACLGGSECAEGHTGFLCHFCVEGYFLNSNGVCTPCKPNSVYYLPLILVVILLGVAAAYKIANQNKDDNMHQTLGIGTTIGLWINYVQFSSLFGSLAVRWPSTVSTVLNLFSFTNMNVSEFAPECAYPMSYTGSLILRNFAPILYILYLTLLHFLSPLHKLLVATVGERLRDYMPDTAAVIDSGVYSNGGDAIFTKVYNSLYYGWWSLFMVHEPADIRKSVNATLMMFELAYIFIIANLFEILDCKTQPNGFPPVLVANPLIECYSREWTALAAIVAMFAVLYVVVVPIFVAQGIWLVHKAGRYSLVLPTHLWATYSSVFYRYKRDKRFWVIMVLFRKLSVSFVISTFSSYPVTQAAGAFFSLFISFWIHVVSRPFRISMHNTMESVLSAINICMVVFGIVFFINARKADEAARTGVELDSRTAAVTTFLSVFCLFLNIGGTVYAISLVIYSLYLSSSQNELEERIISKKEKADLFAKRNVPYSRSTNTLLLELRIDPESLHRFMSFASDDDVRRLAKTAAALHRLNLIQEEVAKQEAVREAALAAAAAAHGLTRANAVEAVEATMVTPGGDLVIADMLSRGAAAEAKMNAKGGKVVEGEAEDESGRATALKFVKSGGMRAASKKKGGAATPGDDAKSQSVSSDDGDDSATSESTEAAVPGAVPGGGRHAAESSTGPKKVAAFVRLPSEPVEF